MISRLSLLIKQNSLVAYFVIAYAISWAFMLPLALSAQGLIQKQFPYALYYLASTGPALSALIVTAFA
ncbi:MAG TPA: hypothetical protein VE136_10580, partial [Anaerolineales bacterium]|nr:hypothetical protein [Anaerolineales bacterium]